MKKVVTTITAAAFALGLAGAGMAQSAGKEAVKTPVKTETRMTQSQATPKTAEQPAETAKPGAQEVKKPEVKEKGKKAAKSGKKAKKGDSPTEKTPKEGKKL